MAGSILRLRVAVAAVGSRQFTSSSSPAWLMLPSHKMYNHGEKKVVNIKSSNIVSESESDQVVGSSHGWVGLLKVEYESESGSSINISSSSVSVWNPMSGDHIKLPPLHTIPKPPQFRNLTVEVEKLIVDDAECSRAVIIGSSFWLGVCCPGRCSEWTLFQRKSRIDDVVACSQKKLYALHGHDAIAQGCDHAELVRWNISDARRPRMEWKSTLLELGYVLRQDGEDFPRIPDQFPRKPDHRRVFSSPHLVYAEHSDQLFIVTRHYIELKGPGSDILTVAYNRYSYMTVGFDVHLVESSSSGKGKGKGNVRYMKHSLDGLVMFVGLNDSFAVPAADFPHLKPDSIYFTDHPANIQHYWFRDGYGGHDVGIYDYENQMASSCYYQDDHKYCFNPIHPHPFWFTPTSTK